MWVKTNAFVDALETYRNHLVGVAWHRGSLELETGWLRRLCRMTGQNLKLEQWRTLLRLGGGGEVECEMEGPGMRLCGAHKTTSRSRIEWLPPIGRSLQEYNAATRELGIELSTLSRYRWDLPRRTRQPGKAHLFSWVDALVSGDCTGTAHAFLRFIDADSSASAVSSNK